jgi:DNA-binding transcriptional ArsR family regulator
MIINNEREKELRLREIERQQAEEQSQREQAKKNRNFVQIYRDNMPEIRWLMNKNGTAAGILFFILEHMDGKNALACSYTVFEDYFDVSKATVTRALKLLRDNGFIGVLKMGTSNVYVVNTEIAWTSWNNQKEYAFFEGNILVSRKENKDYAYRNQFDRFKLLREREDLNAAKQMTPPNDIDELQSWNAAGVN